MTRGIFLKAAGWLLALSVLLPGQARADNARKLVPWLDLPANWALSVKDGIVTAVPGDLVPGTILVLMVEPEGQSKLTLHQEYEKALQDVGGPWTPIGEANDQTVDGGWVYRIGVGKVILEGTPYIGEVAVARKDLRRVRFWVLADSDVTFNRHKSVVATAMASAQDITLKATPASPPAPKGSSRSAPGVPEGFSPPQAIAGLGKGLTGAWAGLMRRASASASSTSGIDLTLRWEMIVFLADGTYTTLPPQTGLDHADLEILRPRGFFGRYTISGKSVRLETSNGIVSTYAWQGKELKATGKTSGTGLTRVDSGVGLRLDGTFARRDITPKDFPGDALPTLTFGTDGRFVDHRGGVYSVFSSNDPYNASGQGRYSIANNSLYLIYEDGRRKKIAFAVLPKAGDARTSPSWLLVGTRWMTRR